MASVVDICNTALNQLGASTILTLTEDSKNARLCNARYTQIRDAVFRSHPFNCLQKRVELGRALAPKPEVVLLDEPFTSLDAQMARDLREEVVSLLRATKTTGIIVTHDQEEALSVCDIVSVLENGKVIQSATPQEIYLNPISQTVANSVGDPNIIKGISTNGRVKTSLGTFNSAYDGELDVSIRPECIEVNLDSNGEYVVKECIFYGHDQVISFENKNGEIFRARSLPSMIFEPGDIVCIDVTEVTTFPSKN